MVHALPSFPSYQSMLEDWRRKSLSPHRLQLLLQVYAVTLHLIIFLLVFTADLLIMKLNLYFPICCLIWFNISSFLNCFSFLNAMSHSFLLCFLVDYLGSLTKNSWFSLLFPFALWEFLLQCPTDVSSSVYLKLTSLFPTSNQPVSSHWFPMWYFIQPVTQFFVLPQQLCNQSRSNNNGWHLLSYWVHI